MHHDPTFWLLARAAGITAYSLLALSVLAGLVLKSRPTRRLRPAAVTEVHKTLAVMGLGALALHGTALVLDSTVKVTPTALLMPGLVSYRPVPVALGVIGGWLFALVTASFWLRKRIGVKNWRRLHWFTYALFTLATLHGLLSGTDTAQPWMRDLYLGALGAVAAATAWRVLAPPARRAPREAPAR
ncbi:MAG: ferric reductase-like transmembrane domain-containing protein [Gaiellaceae bacterium]